MRNYLAMCAAIFSCHTTAWAADFFPPPPTQQVMFATTPVQNWSGFYVGVHGGYGGDQFAYPISAPPATAELTLTSSGFFAGGQVGYNFQAQSFVFGVEADIAWSDIEGKVGLSAAVPGLGLSASAGTQLDWFGTVRGRIGFLVTPSTMIYGTGGWAFGETTTFARAAAAGLAASTSISHNKSGWTAGGGLEYAINPWSSFKAEYLYIDLGTDNLTSFTVGAVPVRIAETTTVHTFKAGLNLRFGGLGLR